MSIRWKRRILIVLGLLGLACLMQALVIGRAATTELDTVRFVAIAQSIDQRGLLETLRHEHEQPLYPLAVWATRSVLEAISGQFPSIGAAGAQGAAAAALVLTVVPLFFLLRRLIDETAATVGTLFFCVLPAAARLGADGLSDSTHLLFVCIAFWAMVEYLEGRSAQDHNTETGKAGSIRWLLLAGLAVGTATLARAEVLVLAAAFGLTLAAFQCLPRRRVPWSDFTIAGGQFLLGLALIWGPYLTVTDSLAPRAAVARLLGRPTVARDAVDRYMENAHDHEESEPQWRLPDGESMSFAAKDPTQSIRQRGLWAALGRFGLKLADATGYWIGGLAIWGSVCLGRPKLGYRPDGRATASDRLVQVFVVLYTGAILRFCAKEGYLDSRHLMPLVLAVLGAAGLGAWDLGTRLGRAARLWPERTPLAVSGPLRKGCHCWLAQQCSRFFPGKALLGKPAVAPNKPENVVFQQTAWGLVALAAAGCVPLALIPLHDNRLGHRRAAEWLQIHAPPSATVLDTRGLTGLYSGRETIPFTNAAAVLGDPHLAYLVLEQRELGYPSRRGRTLRWLCETAGEPVAQFPSPPERTPSRAAVVVFRWYPARFRQAMGENLALPPDARHKLTAR